MHQSIDLSASNSPSRQRLLRRRPPAISRETLCQMLLGFIGLMMSSIWLVSDNKTVKNSLIEDGLSESTAGRLDILIKLLPLILAVLSLAAWRLYKMHGDEKMGDDNPGDEEGYHRIDAASFDDEKTPQTIEIKNQSDDEKILYDPNADEEVQRYNAAMKGTEELKRRKLAVKSCLPRINQGRKESHSPLSREEQKEKDMEHLDIISNLKCEKAPVLTKESYPFWEYAYRRAYITHRELDFFQAQLMACNSEAAFTTFIEEHRDIFSSQLLIDTYNSLIDIYNDYCCHFLQKEIERLQQDYCHEDYDKEKFNDYTSFVLKKCEKVMAIEPEELKTILIKVQTNFNDFWRPLLAKGPQHFAQIVNSTEQVSSYSKIHSGSYGACRDSSERDYSPSAQDEQDLEAGEDHDTGPNQSPGNTLT